MEKIFFIEHKDKNIYLRLDFKEYSMIHNNLGLLFLNIAFLRLVLIL